MDLADLRLMPVQPRPRVMSLIIDPHDLVAQLGSEVASTLSAAVERVHTLAATGKIDRSSLRALRDEIDHARRMGMMGQQLARLASGRVPVSRERMNLTNLLREALRQRAREIDARGIEVRQVFVPTEVMSDATLLFSLLQTLLDWSFEHAVSRIDLTLDIRNWPACARLVCAYAHQQPDLVDDNKQPAEATLETMSWRLLHQIAAALALKVQRKDAGGRTTLTLEFPETLAPRVERAEEFGDSGSDALNSQPLAGRHVLVVSPRREVRNTVRQALRPMGLMVDFVTSADEAAEFCRAALPHALIHEASMAGERFERLRNELLADAPGLAVIQIGEQGKAVETVNVGGRQIAIVGRDAILASLQATLSHELARLSDTPAR
jgi:CheY-like chemotaxis protein